MSLYPVSTLVMFSTDSGSYLSLLWYSDGSRTTKTLHIKLRLGAVYLQGFSFPRRCFAFINRPCKKTMKKILTFVFLSVFVLTGLVSTAEAATRIKGYYRSNGTYVRPYYRSDSNSSRYDNYSYYGNYNPYTGKYGTKR